MNTLAPVNGQGELKTTPLILLVDDDPGVIQATSKALQGVGRLRFATNGFDALRLMTECSPDLVLLDSSMPKMSGLQVFEAIKADSSLSSIPVIFVTGRTEDAFERQALDLGAVDFIPKPIRPEVVMARVRTQLRAKYAADQLKSLAHYDGLTGVGNRRSFDIAWEREVAISLRQGQPMSLLMIDIDHFKVYNDHYGHQAGDRCLQSVAQTLRNELKRVSDLVFRYGGEEFAAILPDTLLEGAMSVATRVLESVRNLNITHIASRSGTTLSLSVGVASFKGSFSDNSNAIEKIMMNGDGSIASALLELADSALYQAKANGRDRAVGLHLESRVAQKPSSR